MSEQPSKTDIFNEKIDMNSSLLSYSMVVLLDRINLEIKIKRLSQIEHQYKAIKSYIVKRIERLRIDLSHSNEYGEINNNMKIQYNELRDVLTEIDKAELNKKE